MASVKKIKTSRGDRWVVRWRVDGKPVKRRLKSAAAANALKVQVESDTLAGVSVDPRRGVRKLNDYFDGWLDARIVKGRPLAPNTKYGYRKIWDRNIADTIGKKQLRQVDRTSVREWHGKLTTEKSGDQAAKAYRLLHAVFVTAVNDELVRHNPVMIRGGGMEHQTERPLVETSVALAIVDAVEARYRALVLLVAFAATRTSEVLSLRRCDVDLLHREVTINRQAHEIAGKRIEVEHTKSDAGMRRVDLPNLVVDALDTHLATFVGEAAAAPLFTGPEGGPLTRKALSLAWRSACVAVGVVPYHAQKAPNGLRLYDLRHHAATLTARKPGITTKELMARIGHSTLAAALRYQHATQERDREIADFIDGVVANVKPEPKAPVVDGRALFAPSDGEPVDGTSDEQAG